MNIGKIYSQNLIDWAPCLPEYFNEGLCLAYKEDMIDFFRKYLDLRAFDQIMADPRMRYE